MENRTEKLKEFAKVLEFQQLDRLEKSDLDSQANIYNCHVTIKPGKKYDKIDVGGTGKYMVDLEGNIYGIKGYGQINKKNWYGTLETIDNYNWSGYRAFKKKEYK